MSEEPAALLTYNTKKEEFESVYERNKFYRGLFGYRQTVKKNGKKYEYEKDGLMDRIPSVRVDDSVFVLARKNTERVEDYFVDWRGKVSYHIFKVLIEDSSILEQIKGEKGDKHGR
ncbi:MAG: hypothetical protein ABEJ98_04065 [Candidatus Nanohaloarchaea archaeon]